MKICLCRAMAIWIQIVGYFFQFLFFFVGKLLQNRFVVINQSYSGLGNKPVIVISDQIVFVITSSHSI